MLASICVCLTVLMLCNIDLNCRFITFNTRLNTLVVSTKTRTVYLNFSILLLLYLILFEYYFLVFIPCEFWKGRLSVRRITKSVFFVKMFHNLIARITLSASYRLRYLVYINILCFCHYPHQILAVWLFLIRLTLCPDIHPNPGPAYSNNFAGGFLSFCNWNLNTLSKDDFSRITLLQAHNTEHNYDIISLCETSLNDDIQVPEMPGYKFHSCNHPDGNRSGGVGIFYKESLPLKIRDDHSFNERIVCELNFGHKHIFYSFV